MFNIRPVLYLRFAATVCLVAATPFDFYDIVKFDGGIPTGMSELPLDKASQNLQKMMAQNPNGLDPTFTYAIKDETLPEMSLNLKSTISSIDFYATGTCQ